MERRFRLSWLVLYKAAILILLIGDTAAFFIISDYSAGLDNLGWLILLLLFEAESLLQGRIREAGWLGALHAARLLAIACVVLAYGAYVAEQDWLDVANDTVWLMVVAFLEVEVRYSRSAARLRWLLMAVATVLYGSLAGFVVAWFWQGAWLDAFDASIWLVAFITIELDVLRLAERTAARSSESV